METLEYYKKMKNGHSEDDTFHHTTSKTENCKRIIFITKVLP